MSARGGSKRTPDSMMSESSANSEFSSLPPNKRKTFDIRWLVLLVILTAVFASTLYLNLVHTDNSIDKVSSTIDIDNGDLDIDWNRYPTYDIELSDSLEVTTSGTYHLTGELEDGHIAIRSGAEGKVRLILDNVSINNSDGSAIACYSADDLVIELSGTNYISDGETYATTFDEDVTGAIYSKADLAFWGEGKLTLTSNYQDGVVGKDDVTFRSGTYDITAKDDGIRGKDSVYVLNGNYLINSGADSIKSTNELDAGKGFVMIEDGNFSISASGKGIKSTKSLLLYGGNFAISSSDDAMHSDNYVGIVGGNYNVSSDDDGIHANRELLIRGGSIRITKSYEGLEAQSVRIEGGDISINSFDDGINAGGGADGSSLNRAGGAIFNTDENCSLMISGGNIYINASGDGVDSNGWLHFNGGNTIIDGPTTNGNGALDSGMGIIMNGGTVFAVGASGMAESLGSISAVYNISIFLPLTYPEGTKIEIRDVDDNAVLEHVAAKTFNHIAAGSEGLKLGNTYNIFIDNELYSTFVISNTTTILGNANNQQFGPDRDSAHDIFNGTHGGDNPGGDASEGNAPGGN